MGSVLANITVVGGALLALGVIGRTLRRVYGWIKAIEQRTKVLEETPARFDEAEGRLADLEGWAAAADSPHPFVRRAAAS